MKKVILINGSAGVGKTTIATKYIEDNPLSMSIEGDQIIGMMGQWRKYEDEARELVFVENGG
jgi:2-phosphoglycerate kinase